MSSTMTPPGHLTGRDAVEPRSRVRRLSRKGMDIPTEGRSARDATKIVTSNHKTYRRKKKQTSTQSAKQSSNPLCKDMFEALTVHKQRNNYICKFGKNKMQRQDQTFQKCHVGDCKVCRHYKPGFIEGLGRFKYQTFCANNELITCRTQNVIYLITCKRCQLQYVGETALRLY
jgi:urocanate hydratase